MARRKSFEEKMQRFSGIVERMEEKDVGLEESVSLYREGVALAVELKSIIDKAEMEVTMLTEKLDGNIEESAFN